MNLVRGLKAVASERRLAILRILGTKEVRESAARGMNATGLRKRLGISQPALSEQMQVLLNTGLVESRAEGRSVIYSRDEERIRQFRQTIMEQLLPPGV
jgi:DNA-binding transcriptional ArsR family regulator